MKKERSICSDNMMGSFVRCGAVFMLYICNKSIDVILTVNLGFFVVLTL